MAMADEIEQRARQIEALAAELHGLYQAEAHRQGDVRHPDEYDELPERLKEYDRELARFVLEQTADAEARVKELEVALQGSHDAAAYSKNELTQERDQAQADLAALKEALDDVLIGLNNILPSLVGHKEIILTKHPMPCRNLDFCIVRDAERRLERNQHVLDQSHPGTALLQERAQLREKVKWLEALNDKGVLARIMEGGQWLEERDAALARVDRLRALLMLAYDFIGLNRFYSGGPERRRLLQAIAAAVSPVGQVTEADIEWAKTQLQGHQP